MFSTTTNPTLTYRLALEIVAARRDQIHPFQRFRWATIIRKRS